MQAGTKPESVLSDHFESHIRPVLAQQCFACHTNSKSGGLRLDSREDMLAGGKSGPALVPGDPDKSLLIAALQPQRPAQDAEGRHAAHRRADRLLRHLGEGRRLLAGRTRRSTKEYTDAAEDTSGRCSRCRSTAVPAVKDAAWPINDIDRFVLARLEKEGLKPATTADRRTLLRRVTYDLTGLMPTYEEVQAFESDKSPNAWEKVVDRLLASPQLRRDAGRATGWTWSATARTTTTSAAGPIAPRSIPSPTSIATG